MTRLSVNINKVATLRNARGENNPDIVRFAIECERLGAQGITVHPRPDERHIKYSDIPELRKVVMTEFNIEGYPSEEFMKLVIDNRPEQVTLVPDAPGQITSNSGWDVVRHADFLREMVDSLKKEGIRSSIFVNPDEAQVRAAADVGAERIELYTKAYADNYEEDRRAAVSEYVNAGMLANELGLGINAGHDLSLENLRFFQLSLPFLKEVSIGHALISDALYLGLPETIRRYLLQLDN